MCAGAPHESASHPPRAPWRVLACSALALASAVALALVLLGVWWALMVMGAGSPVPPELAAFDSLKAGMTEAQVIELLGEPDKRYTAADAPAHYQVSGYLQPTRDISGSVLIYEGIPGQGALVWRVYYVFLDPSGRVEEVFMGAD